jgi:hypothetical protein
MSDTDTAIVTGLGYSTSPDGLAALRELAETNPPVEADWTAPDLGGLEALPELTELALRNLAKMGLAETPGR